MVAVMLISINLHYFYKFIALTSLRPFLATTLRCGIQGHTQEFGKKRKVSTVVLVTVLLEYLKPVTYAVE